LSKLIKYSKVLGEISNNNKAQKHNLLKMKQLGDDVHSHF